MAQYLLSIVIPAYNESESINDTISQVINVCEKICLNKSQYEILVIDDGSTDGTSQVIEKKFKVYRSIKVLKLAVNSGHMAALTAGYLFASGDWVATLDGDGQDPPHMLEEMFNKCISEKSDICFAVRNDRKSDPIRHRFLSPIFYKMLNFSTSGNAPIQAADFRLMSRRAVNALNELPEHNRVYRVLVGDLKFKTSAVYYNRERRLKGKSKYGFLKLSKLAMKSFLATAGLPLRFISVLSMIIAILTLIFSIVIFIISLNSEIERGWTSLALLVTFVMFFQSLTSAVISEILLQINADVRKRPLFQLSTE